ncbi:MULTISPECIES: Uma2 family endonuclease [Spirulina sp. CCY15215]|uniref:Uma2 family endonuclease n=1 Tax=Spirulina sp. CCY15215 TaxID=2767591 RepID=UPI00194E3E17|nr:Uma2 family endonuclease [Spirulina major]
MSVELIREQAPPDRAIDELTHHHPPTDLPYDDGEPLESNRHRIAMNVLIDSIQQAYQGRDDYYAGGNMFMYYSSAQVKNKDFRGPDVFVTLNVDGTRERRSWIVWEEEGRYPDTIVELMSPSTASVDTGDKKQLYEQTFRTQNYFVYNPFDRESLQGWHLGGNLRYEDLTPDERGWLWCESLGLWLGTWEGTLRKETAIWLRVYDRSGNLVLLPEEIAQQEREIAEQERERAILAEADRDRQRQEKERAEAIAEEERRKNKALRDRLQQLGIDPDAIG